MTQQRDQRPDRAADADLRDDHAAERAAYADQRPKFELSATTVTAGVVASTASALLGSSLGVAGTILGAALGAVAYALASALYTHSVAAARFRVRERRNRQGGNESHGGAEWGALRATASADGANGVDSPRLTDTSHDAVGRTADGRTSVGRTSGGNWRAVLAGAVGSAFAFALALVLITGIESAKGAPLGGGSAGGLSVLGGESYGHLDLSRPVTVPDPGEVTRVHTATTTATSTHTSTSVATQTSTSVVTTTETVPPTTSATDTASPPMPASGPDAGLPTTTSGGSDGGSDGSGTGSQASGTAVPPATASTVPTAGPNGGKASGSNGEATPGPGADATAGSSRAASTTAPR